MVTPVTTWTNALPAPTTAMPMPLATTLKVGSVASATKDMKATVKSATMSTNARS